MVCAGCGYGLCLVKGWVWYVLVVGEGVGVVCAGCW